MDIIKQLIGFDQCWPVVSIHYHIITLIGLSLIGLLIMRLAWKGLMTK